MEKQSVDTEFVWVEEVTGDLGRRQNRIVRVDEDALAPVERERYRSVFVSDGDLPRYWESSRGVENPSGIIGFDGRCTIREIPFDFDRESNGKPDWDQAIEDARRFLSVLHHVYDVDLGMARCSLTGGRGLHIRLPAAFFGEFTPSKTLPGVVKEVAAKLANEAGIETDLGIYDRNRVLRVPNSRHKSGSYCVPVYVQELMNEEIPDLLRLMDSPRSEVSWIGDVAPVTGLVDLRRSCEKRIGSQAYSYPTSTSPPDWQEADIASYLKEHNVEYSTKGTDYVLHCPSGKHADQTPSLHLDRIWGIYKCFGCDLSGNWEKFQELVSEACVRHYLG